MFHAVLFDLFETLVTESGSSPVRASHLATRLRIDPEGYRSEWKRRRPDIVLEYSSLRQALIDIGSALERTIEESTLAAIINNRIHDKTAVLQSVEPIVLEILERLRSLGLKLGVISNCFPEDVSAWAHSPLCSFFDVTVFSFAAKLAKPDPRIYRRACDRLRVEPRCTLFVGDGGDDELSEAERAGLRTIQADWFRSGGLDGEAGSATQGLSSIAGVMDVLEGTSA